MSKRRPKISCIIALYNKGESVELSLRSLLSQTMTDWEAVIVDDGSTDHGPDIVREYARHDQRFRIVTQPNGGVSAARNAGLDHARGTFVHFFDADDVLYPQAYALLLDAVREDVEGATGTYDVSAPDGRKLATPSRASEIVDLDDLVYRSTIWTGAHIVRRNVVGSLRFNTSMPVYEDVDMWMRIAEKGTRWRYIRDRVARYIIWPSSASKQAVRYITLAEECMTNLFNRQRALGRRRRLTDTSDQILDSVLGDISLRYATRAVVLGGMESIAQIAAHYERARGLKAVTPGRAASMGHSAVVHGLGQLPVLNVENKPSWKYVLDAWWKLLEEKGWGIPGMTDGAWYVMRTWRVPPLKVCNTILERVGESRELTLVGLGQNGRLLAEHAINRGYRVFVRDDRFADGILPQEYRAVGLIGERIDAEHTRPVVITPLDDERLASRFAECKPLRWHETLMELARLSCDPDVVEAGVCERAELSSLLPMPEPVRSTWQLPGVELESTALSGR